MDTCKIMQGPTCLLHSMYTSKWICCWPVNANLSSISQCVPFCAYANAHSNEPGYIDSPGIFQIATILWSQLGQLAFHHYQPLSTYKLQTFHTSHLKLPGNSAPWIIYCFLIKIILYRLYMIHASMIIYVLCAVFFYCLFSLEFEV